MSLVETIAEKYTEFSPKDRLIATYLLQEQQELGNISIQDLAKEVGTSPATITRFCRKVGCDSYVDLKIQLLALNQNENNTKPHSSFDLVSQYYNRVIERTSEQLEEEEIIHLIHLLKKANRITIYGIGSSGLTAREFASRLSRMGLNAISETDSHMMIISSAIIQKDDIVIGLSNSGETKEVIYALKNAKENQAIVVSMTSMKNSSLSMLADHTFFVHSSRFVNNEHFVNSQLPFYYLIDLITLQLLEDPNFAMKMKVTVQEILQKSNFTEDL